MPDTKHLRDAMDRIERQHTLMNEIIHISMESLACIAAGMIGSSLEARECLEKIKKKMDEFNGEKRC